MKKIYEENIILPTAVMACNDLMAVGAVQIACISIWGKYIVDRP